MTRASLTGTIVVMLVAMFTTGARAQLPTVHHRYEGSWPPGTIGQYQLRGDLRRSGYFQPVEIQAPEGALISMAEEGAFQRPQPAPVKVAMQIGSVYRFKVMRIPLREGAEVFPTIELIDRLHPPDGAAWRFPIPVQLTREELELALSGKYVTRVIYVENPTDALPQVADRRFQRYFEVRPDSDPVRVADELGRPVAILRIGSRVPSDGGPDEAFLYNSPPLVHYDPARETPPRVDEVDGNAAVPFFRPPALPCPCP
jgi:hypothetical protein